MPSLKTQKAAIIESAAPHLADSRPDCPRRPRSPVPCTDDHFALLPGIHTPQNPRDHRSARLDHLDSSDHFNGRATVRRSVRHLEGRINRVVIQIDRKAFFTCFCDENACVTPESISRIAYDALEQFDAKVAEIPPDLCTPLMKRPAIY